MKKLIISIIVCVLGCLLARSADSIVFDFVNNDYGMTRYAGVTDEYNSEGTVINDGPVSLVPSGRNRLWADGLRFYADSYMTISTNEGKIVGLELFRRDDVLITSGISFTPAGGTGTYSSWNGSVESLDVAFDISTGNVVVGKMVVYYETEGSRTPAYTNRPLYLMGDFNEWRAGQDAYKLTETSTGIYEWSGEYWEADNSFQISDTFGVLEIGSADGSLLQLDVPHSVKDGSTHHIYTEKALLNPHFVFDTTAMTLTLTGEVAEEPRGLYPETMYIIGDEFNWDIENPIPMTTLRDGVYTITIEGPFSHATQHFRMVSELGDWMTENQYGSRNEVGETADGNLPITLVNGKWNGPAYKGNKDNWTITSSQLKGNKLEVQFDMTTMTVYVGGESGTPSYTNRPLYLRGDFNEWQTEDAYKMTETRTGIYEWSGEVWEADVEFLITDPTGILEIGSAKVDNLVKIGVAHSLEEGSSYHLYTEKRLLNPHFVFDTAAMTLTLTGSGVEPVDPSEIWGLVGDFNGWNIMEAVPMRWVEDGIWTLTCPNLTGQFRFVKGNDWQIHLGANIGYTESLVLSENGTYDLLSGGGNFEINDEVETLTITLNLNTETVTFDGLSVPNSPIINKQLYLCIYDVDANEWHMPDECNMTETSTGIYEYSGDVWDSEVLFFITDATSVLNIGSADENTLVEVGVPHAVLVMEGSVYPLYTDTEVRNPHFVLDTYAMTLTLTSGEPITPPEPDYSDLTLYVIGEWQGWTLGDYDCMMTEIDEGVYEWSGDVIGNSFKINDGTWNFQVGVTDDNSNELLQLGEPFPVGVGFDTYDTIYADSYGNIKNPHLVLDTKAKTVTLTGTADGSFNDWREKPIYLCGAINSNKLADPNYQMTMIREGVYEWTGETLRTTDTFCINNGTGTVRFGAASDNALKTGESQEVVWNSIKYFHSQNTVVKPHIVFDAINMTLTVYSEGQQSGDDEEEIYVCGTFNGFVMNEASKMVYDGSRYVLYEVTIPETTVPAQIPTTQNREPGLYLVFKNGMGIYKGSQDAVITEDKPYCELRKNTLPGYTYNVYYTLSGKYDIVYDAATGVLVFEDPDKMTPKINFDEGLVSFELLQAPEDPDVEVTFYYTLDGSTPTVESTVYEEPFMIDRNYPISVVAVGSDSKSGYSSYTPAYFSCPDLELDYATYDGENVTAYYPLEDAKFTLNSVTMPPSGEMEDGKVKQVIPVNTLSNNGQMEFEVMIEAEYLNAVIQKISFDWIKPCNTGNAAHNNVYFKVRKEGVLADIVANANLHPALFTSDSNMLRETGLMLEGTLNEVDVEALKGLGTEIGVLDLSRTTMLDGKLPDNAFSGMNISEISLPKDVVECGADLLANNANLSIVVWNSQSKLTFTPENPNCLIFVPTADSAPTGGNGMLNNVVVGNECKTLRLYAGQPFGFIRTPNRLQIMEEDTFTARSATYERTATQQSGYKEVCQGWETVSVPFTPGGFAVEDRFCVPYEENTNPNIMLTNRLFWLYGYNSAEQKWEYATGVDGVRPMVANRPYIFSLPNNDVYREDWRLSGNMIFIGEHVEVNCAAEATLPEDGFSGLTLHPFFNRDSAMEEAGGRWYRLNAYDESGEYRPGSTFLPLAEGEEMTPFEAYMLYSEGGAQRPAMAPAFIPVFSDTSGIPQLDLPQLSSEDYVYRVEAGRILITALRDREIVVATPDGMVVRRVKLRAGEETTVDDLAKGLYLVGREKVLVK